MSHPHAAVFAPSTPPVPLTEATHAWLADLKVAGRSARTIGEHAKELHRFARWIEVEAIAWHEATPRDLKRYSRSRAHLGASARGATHCSLRLFYAWAALEGEIAVSPAEGLKTPRRDKPVPKALTRPQIRTLLAFLAENDREMARRDEALLTTLLYAGLRCEEAAELRWADIDLDSGVLAVRLAKGKKGRVITLHAALSPILARWRELSGGQDSDRVFGSIPPARVGKIARKASERSGIDFTAHALRHSFATHALRGSGNIYAVSKALGHGDIRITERIYIATDAADGAPAVAALPGIADW